MTASDTATTIPGYVAGTWTIDPVHSEIGFSVRHMMVSKVRGKFSNFSGQIVTAEDPFKSSATADIDLKSINTGQDQRDEHIRSADFFEVETYPTMTYRSSTIWSLVGSSPSHSNWPGGCGVHTAAQAWVASIPIMRSFPGGGWVARYPDT